MEHERLHLVCVCFLGITALTATAGMVVCTLRDIQIPPGLSGIVGTVLGLLSAYLPLPASRGASDPVSDRPRK